METCKQVQQKKRKNKGNIELENYSSKKHLEINNIPEVQNESTSTITITIILNILNNEINVDTYKMSF